MQLLRKQGAVMSTKLINAITLLLLVFVVFTACGAEDDTADETDGDTDVAESDSESEIDGDAEASEDDGETTLVPISLKIMTYNVMCIFCGEGYDGWTDRLEYFKDIFQRHDPDILGIQELFAESDTNDFHATLPGYDVLYFKDDSDEALLSEYPDAAIFYRNSMFEVVENGYYWLSETPDVPWSGGWAESNLWRIVAWAHFRHIDSGREFYFASTHFDNNIPNQENSAPLALAKSQPWAEAMPLIFVGDFNSKPDSIAYNILANGTDESDFHFVNTFDFTTEWSAYSNVEEEPAYDPSHRIDHIWAAGDHNYTSRYWIVDVSVYGDNSLPPSDHYPMVAEISF